MRTESRSVRPVAPLAVAEAAADDVTGAAPFAVAVPVVTAAARTVMIVAVTSSRLLRPPRLMPAG